MVNNKVYIGQTKHSVETRYGWHVASMRLPGRKDYAYHLKNAMRKYGLENFVCEQVDTADSPQELNRKEMEWIAKYQAHLPQFGYNDTSGGDNGNWQRSRKTVARCVMTRKLNLMAKANAYIGVFWDEERDSYRYEIKQADKLLEIRRGFVTQEDCALARDIALAKYIKDDEECKMYMNFPGSYSQIITGEIKAPNRRMKRALRVSKYKWVQYDPIQEQWMASVKKKGEPRTKKGMFSTEEEAAIVADLMVLSIGRDISDLNFPERIGEYKDPAFQGPKTVLQKRKTSCHRYVTLQKSKIGIEFWGVDTRTFPLIKIRKTFKNEKEAVEWRNARFAEANIPLPD